MINAGQVSIGTAAERAGLSLIRGGRVFYESDTGLTYIGNEAGAAWIGPIAAVGSGVTGQVAYWSAVNQITGNAGMTYDGTTLSVVGIADGGLGSYDLNIGDVTTPDYGMIRIGDAVIGRTSYNVASMDINGAVVIRNMGTPPTSFIEFVFTESGGDAIRFALAKSGIGNATYNPRSMLIAGPAVLDDSVVTVGYWQTNNSIFDNLACDTAGDGADLGVQNDLEVEGVIFTDSIRESTVGAGITLANDPATDIVIVNGYIGVGGIVAPDEIVDAAQNGAAVNCREQLTTYSSNDRRTSAIYFRKSRTDTLLTAVATIDGERLGEIRAFGVTTAPAFAQAAMIRFVQDGAAGATFMPGRIEFRTGTDAAAVRLNMVLTRDGNLVLPKTSGLGIQVEVATPTFPFRDLLGDVFARNTGANKPTFTTYRDTLDDYQFAVADEEFFKFHVPHDYVAGTDIFLHIHWSHVGTLVTGGTVTFEYEASYAKGHNQAAFPASVTGTIVGTASTTQYQHVISEGQISDPAPGAGELDTDDLEPDGVIIMRFELQANAITVSGGGVPDPFIHYVDIHYQSTNIGTKNRTPPFYV